MTQPRRDDGHLPQAADTTDKREYPPFWSASVPSVSARCSVQNWPIGRTPVDAPAERTVRVCSVRLVSFTHRPVAAICYEVEPVDGPARAESRSFADGGLVTAATVLAPGQKLRVIKFGG
jgi:hypothetical protein